MAGTPIKTGKVWWHKLFVQSQVKERLGEFRARSGGINVANMFPNFTNNSTRSW